MYTALTGNNTYIDETLYDQMSIYHLGSVPFNNMHEAAT